MTTETPMHPDMVFVVDEHEVYLESPDGTRLLFDYQEEQRENVIWLVSSAAAFHGKKLKIPMPRH